MVDLRDCQKGDLLISKHGMVITYVEPLPEDDYYDHKIMYPQEFGQFGTRIHDGHVYRNPRSRVDQDHDIIAIVQLNAICNQF